METSDDLIGLWSAEVLYPPGAQSDEVLVIKPDGTGRFEWLNWTLCSADLFRWHIPSPGRLTLVGYKMLSRGDEGQVVEEDSAFAYTDVPYEIVTREPPLDGPLPVLRMRLADYMPDEYGLTRRDTTGFEDPDFD